MRKFIVRVLPCSRSVPPYVLSVLLLLNISQVYGPKIPSNVNRSPAVGATLSTKF